MFRVRHMREADAEAVSALVSGSWRRTYGPLMGAERAAAESATRHQPEMIRKDLSRPHSESFVAESAEGEIVGYAYARVTKGVLWLDRLHVAPDWQGRGCGAALLHAVMLNFVGEPAISAEVIKGNGAALRFYEREGFVPVEERDACGGIGGVPTIIIRRPLSRA
jgi:ribosomal protein S18 acetylase RimI-like enzyme